MKISIITPNLNGMPYLALCLESILSQREAGANLDTIGVDGGSTNGSL